jgi:hypothetical protein
LALSLWRIGPEGGSVHPFDFPGFDAEDFHRRAISPVDACIKTLMDVRDGRFLKKVAELFIALGQPLIRLTQFLADGSFSAFQLGDLLCVKSQFHLIHGECRQRPEHFCLARCQLTRLLVDHPHGPKIQALLGAKGSTCVESDAEVVDERMGSCALVVSGIPQVKDPL